MSMSSITWPENIPLKIPELPIYLTGNLTNDGILNDSHGTQIRLQIVNFLIIVP